MRRLLFRLLPIFEQLLRYVLYAAFILLTARVLGQPAPVENNSHVAQLTDNKSGQSYSEKDNPGKPDITIEICDWYGGAAGAASISMDDSFASCVDILNRNGFKGTCYLSGTDKFTEADWDKWRLIHADGHEIGCHTLSHCSCHILDEATLRWEFSTNKKDIITNLGLREEDVLSFAWPRGDASPDTKLIAGEYFQCARGYHINQLEDKDPSDFMYLKCLNTPHYHHPEDDPPNYFEMADEAEQLGKWVHFVFHNECLDDGAISYLATKNLWVAPVGTVVKYIKERQNSCISDVVKTNSHIQFTLARRDLPDAFDQELTLRVFSDAVSAQGVFVNDKSTAFTCGADHLMFNIRPSGMDKINVITGDISLLRRNEFPSIPEEIREETPRIRKRFAPRNGVVTNIWISERAKLDNLRNNKIKYLFVDVGDTSPEGRIMTQREDIVEFVRLIESYERQHGYDFVILPYSEINTNVYHLNGRFKQNFITDYRELISIGFEGVYVDVEPVRKGQEKDYIEFLREISVICSEETVLGVYAGSLSDSETGRERDNEWQWPLSLYLQVARIVDLICIQGYDYNLHSKKAYQSSIRRQVASLCAKELPCQLMLSVPTHKRYPETIRNALAAYNSEIEKHPRSQFIGVCVFAEWTTIPEEWKAFESGI